MLGNGNLNDPDKPNRDDSRRLPLFGEELAENAETIRQNNEDAIRHHLDLLGLAALGNSELAEILISLLFHWEDIKPSWIAEAFFLNLRQTCEIARSQPICEFSCLNCWVALEWQDQRHMLRMKRSHDAFCRGEIIEYPAELLCHACTEDKADLDEERRQLEQLHHEAQLMALKNMPYEERRMSTYWQRLKRIVLKRAGHRCQVCGRSDIQLNVHHNTYRNFGEEALEDLIALCRTCHKRHHFPPELPDAS